MIISANTNHLQEITNIEKKEFLRPWTKGQIKVDLLRLDNSENLVYLLDKTVIGYLLGYIILDEFQLNNIAVKKKFQSKGIGRLLIENLLYRLKSKDIYKIFLEVSSNNFSAQKLYRSIGFNEYGIRQNYYSKNDHALLFNLDLK